MNSTASRYRVIVIDDTPAIHADFRKVFETASPIPDEMNAAAALLFDDVKAATVEAVEFSIDSAQQGKDGVDMIRAAGAENRPYALAFVDMRMPPGWDGLKTTREIWAVDPRVQVVICTAHSDHSWHHIREELGISDSFFILKKPFDQIEARQLAHALGQKWTVARQNEARIRELEAQLRERTDAVLQTESAALPT